jgi:hypothetical protein
MNHLQHFTKHGITKRQRERWREAINKELKKMEDIKVWKVVKKAAVPQGRRCADLA